MRIFGMGLPELLIIIAIVAVIFGPNLFKKLGKRLKDTGDAAKKALDSGEKAAGVNTKKVDGEEKDTLEKITDFQDSVDQWMENKKDIDTGEGKAEDASKQA